MYVNTFKLVKFKRSFSACFSVAEGMQSMSFDFNAKPKHHWLIHMAQTYPNIYLLYASRAVLKFNTGSVAVVGLKPLPVPGGAGPEPEVPLPSGPFCGPSVPLSAPAGVWPTLQLGAASPECPGRGSIERLPTSAEMSVPPPGSLHSLLS